MATITVEGLNEVRTSMRRLGGSELVKELGAVHKRIGQMVIAAAGGAETGVGRGTGSTLRASAATRSVQLRVGGRFRARFGNWRQWGIDQIWPPPHRPYIVGAAESIEDDILEEYLDGVNAIAEPYLHVERR